MMLAEQFKEQSLQAVVAYAIEVYKENARVTALIEDKAQKTATVAGVFLGAGLAFVKNSSVSQPSSFAGVSGLRFLALAVFLQTGSILFCVLVMKVRQNTTMLPFAGVANMVTLICEIPDANLAIDVQLNMRLDQIRPWSEILETQQQANSERAHLLQVAQALLFGAIVCTGIVTISVLSGVL